MNKADTIIVALDVKTEREALDLVTQLRETVTWFKVGLQLYTAAGPDVVHEIVRTGAKVFLDLKLHDIPNTVAGAVASAAGLGVDMLTIHLNGGEAMIRAAVETAGDQVTIVGVTVLTSQTDQTLGEIGVNEGVEKQVIRLARLGIDCGIRALVASPREAALLRNEFGKDVKIITPGIRPKGVAAGDQQRITTPLEAIEAGADYLVIGRPIVADREPAGAVRRIVAELGGH
jgi:orotidine-5'-phosphate decarboxylase